MPETAAAPSAADTAIPADAPVLDGASVRASVSKDGLLDHLAACVHGGHLRYADPMVPPDWPRLHPGSKPHRCGCGGPKHACTCKGTTSSRTLRGQAKAPERMGRTHAGGHVGGWDSYLRGLERLGLLGPGDGAELRRFAKRKPARGQGAFAWDEEEHPRGQPENKGEFRKRDEAAGGGEGQGDAPEQRTAPEEDTPEARRAAKISDWQANGVRSQTFKAWFGDWEEDPEHASKVVDEQTGEPKETHPIPGTGSVVKDKEGRPVSVYHGTRKGGFEAFDRSKILPASELLYGGGFYFTEDPEIADEYAGRQNWVIDNQHDTRESAERKLEEKRAEWTERYGPNNLDFSMKVVEQPENPPSFRWAIIGSGYKEQAPDLSRPLVREDLPTLLRIVDEHLADPTSLGLDRSNARYWREGIVGAMRHGDLRHIQGQMESYIDRSALMKQAAKAVGITPLVPKREIKSVYLNIRNPFDIDDQHDGAPFRDVLLRMADDSEKVREIAAHRGVSEEFQENALRKAFQNVTPGTVYKGQDIYESLSRGATKHYAEQVLRELGHDGITHIGGKIMGDKDHRVWIAFSPEQIKSTDNLGTFDPADVRIRYARTGHDGATLDRLAKRKPAPGQAGFSFDDADADAPEDKPSTPENCGTGKGGFQVGNTCARKDDEPRKDAGQSTPASRTSPIPPPGRLFADAPAGPAASLTGTRTPAPGTLSLPQPQADAPFSLTGGSTRAGSAARAQGSLFTGGSPLEQGVEAQAAGQREPLEGQGSFLEGGASAEAAPADETGMSTPVIERGKFTLRPNASGKWAWFEGDKQRTGAFDDYEAAKATFEHHGLQDEEPAPAATAQNFAEHPEFARLDSVYGHMTPAEIDAKIDSMSADIAGHARVAQREFNEQGGRRTGAAVSAQAVRDIGQEKLLLGAYRDHKFGQTAPADETGMDTPAAEPGTEPAIPEPFRAVRDIDLPESHQRELDAALDRARALGRPFTEDEVFGPAWANGVELTPGMDARIQHTGTFSAQGRPLYALDEGQATEDDAAPEAEDKPRYARLHTSEVAAALKAGGLEGARLDRRTMRPGFHVTQIRPGSVAVEFRHHGVAEPDVDGKAAEMQGILEDAGFEVSRPFPDRTILGVRKVEARTPREVAEDLEAKTQDDQSARARQRADRAWAAAGLEPPHASPTPKLSIADPSLAGLKATGSDLDRETVAQAARQLEPLPGQTSFAGPEPDPAVLAAKPFSIDDHRAHVKRVIAGEATAAEHREAFRNLLANEDAIKADLSKKTMKELAPRGAGGMRKNEVVDRIFDQLASQYHLGDSITYDPMRGSYRGALAAAVDRTTDEDIARRSAEIQARKAERTKTYTNPETLDEFRRFVDVKGEDALSPEQRAKFDDLRARDRRERDQKDRARQAAVTAFAPGAEATGETAIVEGHHQKRNAPTYTVTVANRLGDEKFREALNRAKALGGSYVNAMIARRYGATPGFQFFDRKSAEDFQKVLGGERVERTEEHAEKRAERIENASERLKALGSAVKERAEEDLGRDRLSNTARRAEMAASAEGRARGQIRLAETMDRISEALASGASVHLNGIRNKAHVEELESQLRRSKWAADQQWRRQYKEENGRDTSYKDQLEREASPVTVEDIDNAQYPYPSIHKDSLRDLAGTLKAIPGAKLLAARADKLRQRLGPDDWQVQFRSPAEIEDYKDLVSKVKKLGVDRLHEASGRRVGRGDVDNLLSGWGPYQRMQAMDIKSPEELRAALREYHGLRGSARQADPVREKERALIGRKIEGFFPTPKPLVDRMLEAADIRAGDSVLEPSAGKGDILDAIRQEHPEAAAVGIEPADVLRDILQAKGHDVVDRDFLAHAGQYDRIVMNPPFERGQDMDHVRHAYDRLKPGGRLVAIMSASPFSNQSKKAEEFRSWLDSVGGEHEALPEGSFAGPEAFRQTGVNTHMVVVDRPGGAEEEAA